MLGLTALDAFIGGFATAFFGAIVAGGAYLLKHQIHLRQRLDGLEARLEGFAHVEQLLRVARPAESLKRREDGLGGDAVGP